MRILYAEDERGLSDAISQILERNNYSVDSVYDGEEALHYLAVTDYDIIILDIMMPKLSGLEVLKTLRRQGKTMPVLLLTAKSEMQDKVEGLDLGADDYLAKPFAAPELLARLRAISRRATPSVEDTLALGNLKLSRSNFQLSSAASPEIFTLSSKEYQILELLMSHPKMFYSKDLLMEKIWGHGADADISVVWVNISNLRKKLQQLGSTVSIKSKRNAGYYLEAVNG